MDNKNKPEGQKPTAKEAKKPVANDRKNRLKSALRQNLQRRKSTENKKPD